MSARDDLAALDREFNSSKTMRAETFGARRAEILAREPAPAPAPASTTPTPAPTDPHQRPVTYRYLKAILVPLIDTIKGRFEQALKRFEQTDKRLADLEQRIESTENKRRGDSAVASGRREWYENALAIVQCDVNELRARPVMTYLGVWDPTKEYGEAQVVTDHGSMFYCRTSTRERPGASADWVLAVKRGADAK